MSPLPLVYTLSLVHSLSILILYIEWNRGLYPVSHHWGHNWDKDEVFSSFMHPTKCTWASFMSLKIKSFPVCSIYNFVIKEMSRHTGLWKMSEIIAKKESVKWCRIQMFQWKETQSRGYWKWVLSFYTDKQINRLPNHLCVCKAGRLALLQNKTNKQKSNKWLSKTSIKWMLSGQKILARDLSTLHQCQAPLTFLIKVEMF